LNKKLFIILGVFALTGVILGLITIFNPRVAADSISRNLIDGNILRVVVNTGIFGIIMGRLLDFAFVFVLLFLVSLHKWTVVFVFIYAAYRGFAIVINLFWIVAMFGAITGIVLAIVYLIWFIVMLAVVICLSIFILRSLASARRSGIRGGIRWRDLFRNSFRFLIVIVVFASIEWLVYWLILSNLVFALPIHPPWF